MTEIIRRGFTQPYESLKLRLITDSWVSDIWDASNGEPEPPRHEFLAFWNTGATMSCISQDVVDTCGLVNNGFGEMRHARGTEKNVPIYIVNIQLPNNVFINTRVMLMQIESDEFVKSKKTNEPDVLIGMDIIALGDLAISNKNNRTKLTFQMPSSADIDFVEEINRASRNTESRRVVTQMNRDQARKHRDRRRTKSQRR